MSNDKWKSNITNQYPTIKNLNRKWRTKTFDYFQTRKMSSGSRETRWSEMVKHRLSKTLVVTCWFFHFFNYELRPKEFDELCWICGYWEKRKYWLFLFLSCCYLNCVMLFIVHYWFRRGEANQINQKWKIEKTPGRINQKWIRTNRKNQAWQMTWQIKEW